MGPVGFGGGGGGGGGGGAAPVPRSKPAKNTSATQAQSSGDAGGLRWQLRFLEDSHLFRDGLRLRQHALIEQPGDRLDNDSVPLRAEAAEVAEAAARREAS